ncbi:MAG: PD-(D/E)XK nuclease family protein [Steroidobacteraceae bacterium]
MLASGATLVTPSRQRATAVRLAYASEKVRAGQRLWRSPDVLPWAGWLEREWARTSDSGPRVLRSTEEWLLWRTATAENVRDLELFDDSIADNIRRAAILLEEWRIRPAALRGAPGSEPALLVRATSSFTRACAELGAVPDWRLAAHLAAQYRPAAALRVAGFASTSPAQRELLASLNVRGADASVQVGAEQVARTWIAQASDRDHEIDLVAGWARRLLAQDPARRLLIVLPDADDRAVQLARALRAALSPQDVVSLAAQDETPACAIEGGQPLARWPLVAHALEALALCGQALDFDRVSAWLRAPFWAAPDADARARVDHWLRRRARTAFDLRELMEELHRAPPALAQITTELRDRLGRAIDATGDGPATPRTWAERFHRVLDLLGWPGPANASSADQQLRMRCVELLREFGGIHLGIGLRDCRTAVGLLRELANRAAFEPATGDTRVTITRATSDPIVRYDAIWVAGLQAECWPPAVRPDPFVPLRLQQAAGVPQSSPAGQLAQAQAAQAAWRRAAGELVFSFARRVNDVDCVPSPLLRMLHAQTFDTGSKLISLAASLRTTAPLEELIDEVAPDWSSGQSLPLGTRTLELQNLCPFRALAELRLGAEPLEGPRMGIDKRVRGQLLHRALETLWRDLGSHAGLLALDPSTLRQLIERHVLTAGQDVLQRHAADVPALMRDGETVRACALIGRLCELERERAPFTVHALETARSIQAGGAQMEVRIDRVDRLDDGSAIIIDYKSGLPKAARWYSEPVSHPQLLAYLFAVDLPLAAMAIAHVSGQSVAFKGVANHTGLLPKVGPESRNDKPSAELPWPQRIAHWQGIAQRLISDFLAGRAAVEPVAGACATCHLHALCRIDDDASSHSDAYAEERADE